MIKKTLNLKSAPEAKGPYSIAVEYKGLLFLSGQGPIDPGSNNIIRGDIIVQTNTVLSNIKEILAEAGSGLERVLKVVIYLTDINNFSKVNKIYKEYFTEGFPARTCIEVSNLPLGIEIEMDIIAYQ